MIITVIDTETTGLNNQTHEILEIAAISYKINDDGSAIMVESLNKKIKPRNMHLAEPKALEVNGYNEEDWKDACDFLSIWRPLGELIDIPSLRLSRVPLHPQSTID